MKCLTHQERPWDFTIHPQSVRLVPVATLPGPCQAMIGDVDIDQRGSARVA